ncbi:MAG: hypothetical protein HY914_05265 [Desulfomonile tiedjei]|nr:hypothetical protein [Desulfomonile tiedjei]
MEGTRTNQRLSTAEFDLDGMLGGLAKWLRIVGFDTAFPRFTPRGGRWFVTAVKSKGGLLTVWVSCSRPLDQLKEVLAQADLSLDPCLFFSRCVLCNEPVVEVPKEDVAGKVPDKIFDLVSCFHQCPACGRVYWVGSHLERTKERLAMAGIPLDLHRLAVEEAIWGEPF